jgi:hypothetical protein
MTELLKDGHVTPSLDVWSALVENASRDISTIRIAKIIFITSRLGPEYSNFCLSIFQRKEVFEKVCNIYIENQAILN